MNLDLNVTDTLTDDELIAVMTFDGKRTCATCKHYGTKSPYEDEMCKFFRDGVLKDEDVRQWIDCYGPESIHWEFNYGR